MIFAGKTAVSNFCQKLQYVKYLVMHQRVQHWKLPFQLLIIITSIFRSSWSNLSWFTTTCRWFSWIYRWFFDLLGFWNLSISLSKIPGKLSLERLLTIWILLFVIRNKNICHSYYLYSINLSTKRYSPHYCSNNFVPSSYWKCTQSSN